MTDKSTITVTLLSGARYSYETDTHKAREHTDAIISRGYRSVREDGTLTHFPPHMIAKVTATKQSTEYTDKVSGT